MEPILLTTILTCQQVIAIANRLQNIALLNSQQKVEIILELRNSVPSCPVKIGEDKNDKSKKSGN
jgi:hypothetical protein